MGNNHSLTPSAYLFGALIAAALMLIAFTPVAIATGLYLLFKTVRAWMAKKEVTPETVEADESTSTTKQAITAQKKYRKHVKIGDQAVLDVWFHPDKGLARRVVKVSDKNLAEKFGEKFNLAEVSYKDDSEAEAIVAQAVQEAKAKLAGSAAMATTSVAPAAEAPKPAASKSKAIPMPQHRAVAGSTYIGQVIRYGMEQLEGRDYSIYTLHLFDEVAGAPHELTGADLGRAIKEAGVSAGDRVKVEYLGETEVPLGGGKTGKKKLWSVSKV